MLLTKAMATMATTPKPMARCRRVHLQYSIFCDEAPPRMTHSTEYKQKTNSSSAEPETIPTVRELTQEQKRTSKSEEKQLMEQ